ncbi:MAG: sulfurtransferase TusA family protein [Desulfobacter sp.]|nr:MAG: sulfurtransferase TusA family protein [Desulfobacter sp.]
MAADILLDLRGVTSPLDLLKCKSSLNTMKKGDVLEVLIEDQEVVQNLTTIIDRSDDQLIYKKVRSDSTCLGIRKGSSQSQ